MKFCIDCKYHSCIEQDYNRHCRHAKLIVDMVNGKQYYPCCHNERSNPNGCGVDGKYFQLKPQTF